MMAWPVNDMDTSSFTSFENSFVPFEKMPDSVFYLDKLECRLAKLKASPVNSKEVLKGLRSLKESSQLETQSSGDSSFVIEDTVDVFSLERRLFPSRCMVNMEEGQKLLDADVLAATTLENESKKEDTCRVPR